jgi:hypothetical protein
VVNKHTRNRGSGSRGEDYAVNDPKNQLKIPIGSAMCIAADALIATNRAIFFINGWSAKMMNGLN